MVAARYVALNPVRARLVERADDWPHWSVRAHLSGRDDALVDVRPLLDRASSFADLLDTSPTIPASFRAPPQRTDRPPLGDRAFQDAIGRQLGRIVMPGKRGPKPKRQRDDR